MKIAAWALAAVTFIVASYAVAEETAPPSSRPRIIIEFGEGQVKLETENMKVRSEWVDQLRTDLMVSEKLRDVVTGQSKIQIVLDGAAVDRIDQQLRKSLEKAGEEAKNLIINHLKSRSGTQGAAVAEELIETPRRIAFDQDVTVESNEIVDELVVLGGSVKIAGKVKRLVLVGGSGEVLPGGQIIEQSVVIGGKLMADDGADISTKKVEMSWVGTPTSPLSVWQNGIWARLIGLLWLWVVLAATLWIELKIWPSFAATHQELLEKKPLQCLLPAFISIISSPFVFLLFIISLVGIAFLPFLAIGVLVLALFGAVRGYLWVADRFKFIKDRSIYLKLAFGIGVLSLLNLLGSLGYLVYMFVFMAGYGGALWAVWRHFKQRRASPLTA